MYLIYAVYCYTKSILKCFFCNFTMSTNLKLELLLIILVYLSESLGRLDQNGGGALGATFFMGAVPLPPVEPPLRTSGVK